MPSDEILLQLKKILASSPIVNASVLSEFLSFVVTETIEGRGRELKEYTIAIYALHKDADFNPQIDSIVRIHASRLRRALKEYYYENGKDDPIMISIPKGCYTPTFTVNGHDRNTFIGELRSAPDPVDDRNDLLDKLVYNPYASPLAAKPLADPAADAQTVGQKTTMAIVPFNCFNDYSLKSFSKGLYEYLRTELTHFETLNIGSYNPTSSASRTSGIKDPGAVLQADYILTGSVQEQQDLIRVCVQLNHTETGEQVWANTFHKKNFMQTSWEFQEEVVNQILATVTGINGMLLNHERQVFQKQQAQENGHYPLTYWYHKYSNNFKPEIIEQAKQFYENILQQEPSNPLILSYLSEIYSGESYIVHDGIERLDRALSLARRALQINPRCQQAHLALAINFLFRNNNRKCVYLLDQGAAINTKSTDYKGAMGALLIYAGEFERGMAMVTEALQLNPFLPWWHSYSQCLYYYHHEMYRDVITLIDRLSANTLGPAIMKASSFAELGEYKMAKSILNTIKAEHAALDILNLNVLRSLFTCSPLISRIQRSLFRALNTSAPSPDSPQIAITVNR